jgi:hypothetical protein
MPSVKVLPAQRAAATAREADAALVLLAGAGFLFVVLLAHGFLPGYVNDGPWDYLLEGDMRCAHAMGLSALTSWCSASGLPHGYPFLSGGPVIFVGWLLMGLTGMGSHVAYLLANATFDALALAGGYGAMRLLGAGRMIALGTSAAYLLAPTVIGLRDYGGTFTGYTLLPAYAFADLLLMRLVERGERRLLAAGVAGYAAIRIAAVFLDGYSFVGSALVAVVLWGWWAVRAAPPRRRRLLGVAACLLAQALAAGIYALYAPPLVDPAPLGLFRSMSLDLVTLVRPTEFQWLPHLLGLQGGYLQLWGDGSNAAYNYLGFACVGLAVLAVVRRRRELPVPALATAGLIALVLSFGPSWKVNATHPPLPAHPTYRDYLMPAGDAALSVPWGGAYATIPGVDQMRAAYRWSGVTRLALILLAGLAIDGLARDPRRRWLAGALTVVALAELAPNVPRLQAVYRSFHASRTALTETIVPRLAAATKRGERVYFLNDEGRFNDYLATYLTASTGLRSYNAGGDKNALYARLSWPKPIAALAVANPSPDAVAGALRSHAVDVIVAPYFDLRWASYVFPPAPADELAMRQAFAPILRDRRFEVRRYRWFATVRAR